MGGSGDDLCNLIILYQNFVNIFYMMKYENQIWVVFDCGEIVCYCVIFVYNGNDLLVEKIILEVKSFKINLFIDFLVIILNK